MPGMKKLAGELFFPKTNCSPASFSMPGINLPAYRNIYSTTLPTMSYNFKCIRTNFKGSFRTTLPALKLYPINGHSLSVFLVTKVIKDLPLSDPLTIMYAYDQMNDLYLIYKLHVKTFKYRP